MPSRPVETLDVVVGAGPSGLAAGIYLARAGLAHLVFERGRPGGLLRSAGLVECYPGFPGGIAGSSLADRIERQARDLGVRIERAEVTDLAWTGAGFELRAGGRCVQVPAVVLATGTEPRAVQGVTLDPGLPGNRIRHETSGLPERLDGQEVWISGGGDAALDSALQLSERGARVGVAIRGARARAARLLVERAERAGVALRYGWALERVEPYGARLRLGFCEVAGQEVVADWLLVCHGRDPAVALWHRLASPAARLPNDVENHFPGLYMVGDLLRGRCRYAAVAAGDGTRAARLAEALLERYHARPTHPLA